MIKRTSIVHRAEVTDITLSSTFEIGDTRRIESQSKAFAVQREHELFFSDEGNLDRYPIFTQDIPQPVIDEQINLTRYNPSPFIKVKNIDVIGFSASSIFQIGSTRKINNESRVKHIRQLKGEYESND